MGVMLVSNSTSLSNIGQYLRIVYTDLNGLFCKVFEVAISR
jgi:hypothetical protein